ncbi:hypothetical protein [Sphingomonas sp. Leaf33]|uniref:hypothetical protein n=1 Tax=Sphingomonas sp. Leaf33 TaxID=1736215 RepID=UPI0012E1BA98|nr:hypothetical protein [Sphingomonas sp. Leaf33]
MRRATLAVMLASVVAAPVSAQQAASGTNASALSASPFGPVEAGDPATVKMPQLTFTSDGTEAGDFDKYYAFHRADTDYATAYVDIAECDGYARGLQSGIGYMQTPYPYAGTMAGALGGAIGGMMAAAIFGSGEKRRLRRVNMRTCMNFKGYDRYGLPKGLWEEFNFEEGLSGVTEARRRGYLQVQALVASSGTLQGKALGL